WGPSGRAASAAACSLGAAPPPDQAIEVTLVLTSLTLKSVKVSTPGDAVSGLPLPVMWGSSVIAAAPRTAASTGLCVTGGGGGLGTGSLKAPLLALVVGGAGNRARGA